VDVGQVLSSQRPIPLLDSFLVQVLEAFGEHGAYMLGSWAESEGEPNGN
jgi:hypothetical protein